MNSVKFYITPVYPYGNDHYYHEIIVLAEGFRDLGFEVFGNTDYWFQPEKNEYLINGDINSKADIEIYDSRYIKSFAHLLFKKGHKAFNLDAINVLVDRNSWISPDWMIDDNYSIFDIILAGNLLHNVSYPKNVYPSAIGITYRQMEYIDRFTDPCSPESIIAYNFRVQHNLRKLILDNLKKRNNEICYPLQAKFREYNSNDQYSSSIDQFYWEKTTRRHNTEYFKLINQSILFFSVGGYFEFKPVLFQPYSLIDKFRRKPFYLLYKYLTRIEKDISNSIYIFQYDSFRMWKRFIQKPRLSC